MSEAAVVGSILTATAKVVKHVLDLFAQGKPEEATREAERFIAATPQGLDADRSEAETHLPPA